MLWDEPVLESGTQQPKAQNFCGNPIQLSRNDFRFTEGLVVMSVNPVSFVAPHLAWGEARGASARAPGASPGSGAVTDEQRSPRPNGAQPSGQRFFAAQAALLAPYGSTDGICSAARAEAPRALPGPKT